jgi:RimJ/RimL family protein N-acetyltransferase
MIDASLLQTARLALRPPAPGDAERIFQALGSDPEVTRFVGWPRHKSIEDTHAFLSFSQHAWEKWPAGPLLITERGDDRVIGSTGLAFETPHRACTGFVLAREAWGSGFASEALRAMVAVAASLSARRLYALCHVQHARSVRFLERCGFEAEGVLRRYQVFPNLGVPEPQDVYCYARLL